MTPRDSRSGAIALLFLGATGCSTTPRAEPASGGSDPAAPSGEAQPTTSPPIAASTSAAPPPAASAGYAAEPVASAPCPAEMAHLGRFCVDRWEASLAELAADGTERAHPHSERPVAGVRYAARSHPGVLPQGYVNQLEAAAACEAAGKRLCTLREWYRACAGPQGTVYPYGPSLERGACNSGKAHLLGQLFGRDPRAWSYDAHFNSPRLLREPGFLAPTGEYERCVSVEGIHDLVGNLHEWVSDRVDHELPRKIPLNAEIQRKIPKNFAHGIFMGGFFSTTSEHGRGCLFLTPGHEPEYHDYSTGFRCCRDAT